MEIKKPTRALINKLRDLVPKIGDYVTLTPSQIDSVIRQVRDNCERILLVIRNDVAEETCGFAANDKVNIVGETGELTFVGICSVDTAVCRKANAWDVYKLSDISKVPVTPAVVK
jgi:hypothetical protein